MCRLLAVDSQGCESRLVVLRLEIVADGDLASVTLLAVGDALGSAEHPVRRPVVAGGQREIRCNGSPAGIRPTRRLAEPDLFLSDIVEGKKTIGPVGELGEEGLRAPAHHVSAAHDAGNFKHLLDAARLANVKDRLTGIRPRRHHGIGKANRHAIERSDDAYIARQTARVPVGRVLPEVVFVFVALFAFVRADEIVMRNGRLPLVGQRSREVRSSRRTPAIEDHTADDNCR
jgi:hypothetical protein